MGVCIGAVSWKACQWVKNDLGIDDVLDVFSLQAVPGAMGAILVGVFAGGEPFSEAGNMRSATDLGLAWGGTGRLLGVQILCTLVTAAVSAVNTCMLMRLIDLVGR
jgi:ammonia channel protein AmtB